MKSAKHFIGSLNASDQEAARSELAKLEDALKSLP
jgi:hypothetical protein